MKAFFGLLLLSGVLAVQESGIPQKVPCRLSVNNSFDGPRMSSINEMTKSVFNALLRFLESRNLGIGSVVCVTEQLVAGYLYQVQYNGLYWVQIYSPLFGEAQIYGRGVLPEPTEQPY